MHSMEYKLNNAKRINSDLYNNQKGMYYFILIVTYNFSTVESLIDHSRTRKRRIKIAINTGRIEAEPSF